MRNFYRLNLRFNLDNPRERKAVDYLKSLSETGAVSRNQFIVDAVISGIENTQPLTIEDVQRVVRKELEAVKITAPSFTEEVISDEEEHELNILEDLELFG